MDSDQLYERLVGDEDARVCKAIKDDACREVPGNFFRQVGVFTLTKLGDKLISPKTTLPWIFSAVGAPVWMIGWLVPVRESGSLLPQMLIAAWVRRKPLRKWVWVTGGITQALAVLWLAFCVVVLSGATAGWAMLAGVVVFSLARGLSSVASKDVTGKTIPKTRRGRVTGWAASASGLVSILIALWLFFQSDTRSTVVLAGILLVAATAWLVASAIYASIVEFPGATEGGGNAITEAIAKVSLLKTDKPFRHFVIARTLLLVSALSAPYIVLMAREGGDSSDLPLFIIAAGLASLVSGPVWGLIADRSSRQTMIHSALLASAVVLVAVGLNRSGVDASWAYVATFFALSIAHSGVRLGRKTYVLDLAEGNRRTDYVAVANSAMGVMLLVVGGITGLVSTWSVSAVLVLLAGMGVAGAWMGTRLPEVE